jgi:lysozyme
MINNIIDQLKRDEGFRANVYEDTVGKHTIGYGHNLDANPLPDLEFPITEVQATQILGADVERISTFLQRELPWVVSLDDARHGVLQNMSFNMGVKGLLQFHSMLEYTKQGLYKLSASEMIASRWYNEVGDRAKRLVEQMQTGEWA